jgi:biopolymer transport protein ExbD
MQQLIKDAWEDRRHQGKPDTPGVLDPSGEVPWQAVVQAIDALRAAGVQKIEFAAGKDTPR